MKLTTLYWVSTFLVWLGGFGIGYVVGGLLN